MSLRAIVAVPVHDEQDHIVACLTALSTQIDTPNGAIGILLFLNNCSDCTGELVAAFSQKCGCSLRVVTEDHSSSSAGWARRRAMDAAVAWLEEAGAEPEGVVLTTDADSVVPPDWVARNLAALAAGADAVAGRLALDPGDAASLPAALHRRGALEAKYEALLTEIVARLDPIPGNPWPHHWCRSGASLAVRASTYHAIGGMPDVPLGEDRAFVEALLAHDLVVRHDPDLVVVTSGRLQGRAVGGVADTIRRRCDAPDSVCDDRLERLERAMFRAILRRQLRHLHGLGRRGTIRLLARAVGAPSDMARRAAGSAGFGRLHALLETTGKRLAYRALRPAELPRQIRRAEMALRVLYTVADRRTRGEPVRRDQRTGRDVSRGSAAVEACD